MKLSCPADVINYFYWSIPFYETIRAKKEGEDLIVYDKYNNRYRVRVEPEKRIK